jgi:hypothetical protein
MSTMKARSTAVALAVTVSLLTTMDADAQPAGFNYDEAKVPAYTLPDPLVREDGRKVTDATGWTDKRRPELLGLFAEHVYGRMPRRRLPDLRFEVTSTERRALNGLATRKEVTVHFTAQPDGPKMRILIYVPEGGQKPVPAFIGYNFGGNHAVHSDPGIPLAKSWMRPARDGTVENNRATEKGRGREASRWQVEKVISHGYALATIYYGDVEPDHADGWTNGVRSLFHPVTLAPLAAPAPGTFTAGKGAPDEAEPDAWGAIGAWAWGLSRALDYLETDQDIDAKRVSVIGHSRLGKTSLWAGATDERFAIVISNNSGCGGAALSKRVFGETVERINTSFPHWFCGNFKKYNGKEANLPIDQHELIALAAPRPVYVASAEKDLWADPRGEFLGAKHAEPVFKLFGKSGLGVSDMPAIDKPVGNFIGYHIRTGEHDVTAYDWEQYLAFADWHLKGKGGQR